MTTEPTHPEPMLCNKRSHAVRSPCPATREKPSLDTIRESLHTAMKTQPSQKQQKAKTKKIKNKTQVDWRLACGCILQERVQETRVYHQLVVRLQAPSSWGLSSSLPPHCPSCAISPTLSVTAARLRQRHELSTASHVGRGLIPERGLCSEAPVADSAGHRTIIVLKSFFCVWHLTLFGNTFGQVLFHFFFFPPLFPFPILKLNNGKPPWKDLAGRLKFIQLATPSYNNQQGKYQDPIRSLLPGWTLKEKVLNPNQTVLLKNNGEILPVLLWHNCQ